MCRQLGASGIHRRGELDLGIGDRVGDDAAHLLLHLVDGGVQCRCCQASHPDPDRTHHLVGPPLRGNVAKMTDHHLVAQDQQAAPD